MSREVTSTRSLPRGWRLLYLALGTLVVLGLYVSISPVTQASHRYGSRTSIDSVHVGRGTADDIGPIDQETACTDSLTSNLSDSTARTKIRNTIKVDNTTADWHDATGDLELDFWFYDASCGNLSSAEKADTEIEYYVRESTASSNFCASHNINAPNCTYFSDSRISPSGDHYDYKYAYIHLERQLVDDSNGAAIRRHIIDHETGHALGLADPGPCSNDSVMHQAYYCSGNTNYQYPTSADKNSVHNVVHDR